MNRSIKKALYPRLLACALLLVASKGALATCTFMDSRFGPNDAVALDWGTIVVQRDTPVGTIVARTSDSALGGRNNFMQCNASGYTTQWVAGPGFAPVIYGGQTLYQSGVPGLAIRIVTTGAGTSGGRYGTGPLPRQITNVYCLAGGNWWRLCGGTWGNLVLHLIKIAPTTGSGPITTGTIAQALVVGDTNVMEYSIGSGVIQTVACSVRNSNISVTMGKAKNTDFGTPGSTSGDADFAIDLNCDASTNINLTLAPGNAGAADAAKGIINIDNAGAGKTASGVGVQVMYNNAPLALNSRIAVATTAADGSYSIPLKARYYQTQPAVTPGIANANATFTLTYQ